MRENEKKSICVSVLFFLCERECAYCGRDREKKAGVFVCEERFLSLLNACGVCVRVYVNVCMCVCVLGNGGRVNVCEREYVRVCVRERACVYICVFMHMCACARVCVYIYKCVHLFLCVRVFVRA